MNWLLRVAILVVIVLALRSVWRWVWTAGWKRILTHAAERMDRAQTPEAYVGAVKKDPVCGTHVDVELAVREQAGGETLYFCSENCRETYRSQHSNLVSKTG